MTRKPRRHVEFWYMNVGYYVASAFFVPFSLHPNYSEYACQFVCVDLGIFYPIIRAFLFCYCEVFPNKSWPCLLRVYWTRIPLTVEWKTFWLHQDPSGQESGRIMERLYFAFAKKSHCCRMISPKISFISQRVKKVVSDSPGLVDFAVGLVNSVLNLPDWQVRFFGEFKLQKNCNQSFSSKKFFG